MHRPNPGRTTITTTIRLTPELYARAAKAAAERRWPMTRYVAWCIERQIMPGARSVVLANAAAVGREPTDAELRRALDG